MKLRELKNEELEPITEGEEGEEQGPEVPEEPYTEEPFVPSEIPWTPAPEAMTTAYPEEDLDGGEDWKSVDQGVLSDEDETPEESEEEEGEQLPEEPVEEEGDDGENYEGDYEEGEEEEGDGAVEEESSSQATEKKSPMKMFSKIMAQRRNLMKQFKKRKQHALRLLFKKTREQNPERED